MLPMAAGIVHSLKVAQIPGSVAGMELGDNLIIAPARGTQKYDFPLV